MFKWQAMQKIVLHYSEYPVRVAIAERKQVFHSTGHWNSAAIVPRHSYRLNDTQTIATFPVADQTNYQAYT